MTLIEAYRNSLTPIEQKHFDEFYPSVKELLAAARQEGLFYIHDDASHQRIHAIIESMNNTLKLRNRVNQLIQGDPAVVAERVERIRAAGLEVRYEDVFALEAHGFQVIFERLKFYFVIIMNFASLNLASPDRKTLGKLLQLLQSRFPGNKYIINLSTEVRNPLAHYSFYYSQQGVMMCDGYFDPNPKPITLLDFMIAAKKMNILTEMLMFEYRDLVWPGQTDKEVKD